MDDDQRSGQPEASVPGMAGTPAGPVSERMQALLSRAVEDQVGEQRAVSVVLGDLRAQVADVAQELTRAVQAFPAALAALQQDLAELGGRLDALVVPTPDQVAGGADPLVERLAPRVAELVLARVAPALVEQITAATSTAVLAGVADLVHACTADSERRVLAHVDEAVLALAEALLRGRRSARADTGLPAGVPSPAQPAPATSVAAAEAGVGPAQAPQDLAFPDIAAPDVADEPGVGTPVDEDGEALPVDVSGTGDIASVASVADEPALEDDLASAPDLTVASSEPVTGDVAQSASDVPAPPEEDGDGGRRHPWWRPGG